MGAKVETLHPSRTRRGITDATQFATLIGDYGTSDFILRRGGRLSEVTMAYESWGTLSPNYDNVILVFTGLSPTAHAASSKEDPTPGWWEFMIGPGKAIDTDEFFVICVNSLGGCFCIMNWIIAIALPYLFVFQSKGKSLNIYIKFSRFLVELKNIL